MLIIERNAAIGEETSSRNSEVVHGGMYYPMSSLKTTFCIRGRELLYDVCPKVGVPFQKVGKWIFATDYRDTRWPKDISQTSDDDSFEEKYLHTLKDKCQTLGIPSRWVNKQEVVQKEPLLRASVALESPETGIIDSHSLMDYYRHFLDSGDHHIALKTSLISCQSTPKGFKLQIRENDELEGETWIEAKCVVNSAGLNADRVARILMGDNNPYRLYHAKGHYYAYSGRPMVSRLAYPVPDKNLASLGVHTVLDLSGRMRLGPDIEYLDTAEEYPDYHFHDTPERKKAFYETVRRYLPDLKMDHISADFCGIRPKLAPPGGSFQDFIVKHEAPQFEGLVSLIGIESPGLTSSMAIADHVAELLGYPSKDWYPL